jgi:hypothetical protein
VFNQSQEVRKLHLSNAEIPDAENELAEAQDIEYHRLQGLIAGLPIVMSEVFQDLSLGGESNNRLLSELVPLGMEQRQKAEDCTNVNRFAIVFAISNTALTLRYLDQVFEPLESTTEILKRELLYLVACVPRSRKANQHIADRPAMISRCT